MLATGRGAGAGYPRTAQHRLGKVLRPLQKRHAVNAVMVTHQLRFGWGRLAWPGEASWRVISHKRGGGATRAKVCSGKLHQHCFTRLAEACVVVKAR